MTIQPAQRCSFAPEGSSMLQTAHLTVLVAFNILRLLLILDITGRILQRDNNYVYPIKAAVQACICVIIGRFRGSRKGVAVASGWYLHRLLVRIIRRYMWTITIT